MWAAAVPCPVGVLPWGADVAGAQVSWADKQVELQRVGRQPQVWDDDDAVAGAAANAGVSFAGRPHLVTPMKPTRLLWKPPTVKPKRY